MAPSAKRLKTTSSNLPEDCQTLSQLRPFQSFDIIINETISKSLCKCDQCQIIYSKLVKHIQAEGNMSEEDKRLQKNLDGIVDGEDSDEEVKESSLPKKSPEKIAMGKLTNDQYLIQMMAKSMRQSNISHEGQIFLAENLVKFKDYFVSFLQKFDDSKTKVTTKDIEEFQLGLENLRKSNLSGEDD